MHSGSLPRAASVLCIPAPALQPTQNPRPVTIGSLTSPHYPASPSRPRPVSKTHASQDLSDSTAAKQLQMPSHLPTEYEAGGIVSGPARAEYGLQISRQSSQFIANSKKGCCDGAVGIVHTSLGNSSKLKVTRSSRAASRDSTYRASRVSVVCEGWKGKEGFWIYVIRWRIVVFVNCRVWN